jgi:hypothetical protein
MLGIENEFDGPGGMDPPGGMVGGPGGMMHPGMGGQGGMMHPGMIGGRGGMRHPGMGRRGGMHPGMGPPHPMMCANVRNMMALSALLDAAGYDEDEFFDGEDDYYPPMFGPGGLPPPSCMRGRGGMGGMGRGLG